jgi:predicted SAM-dependent methyltransferase
VGNDLKPENSPVNGDAVSISPPLAPPPVTRKLDLACGQMPRDGFEGVDIFVGAQHVVDLQTYPWPFADNSVLELNCSHYIEHIPMEMVDVLRGRGPAKDALFAFFDECYRILVPDGWMTVQWPALQSVRAFQDPTHRRFIPQETIYYMSQEWRRLNKLDHYNVDCNFVFSVNPIIDQALMLRSEEVVGQHLKRYWNSTIDFVAKMQKKPRQ